MFWLSNLGRCCVSSLPVVLEWHRRCCWRNGVSSDALFCSMSAPSVAPGAGCEWHSPSSPSALMPFFFSRPRSWGIAPMRAVWYLTLGGFPLKKMSQHEWGWETPALPFLLEKEILSQVLQSAAAAMLQLTLREARASPHQLTWEYSGQSRT